ncbi:hypothetical protein [Falsiroseomonas sp. HW251]|uniref:hypothetical protein n=1 Tax=Falsiroseomonas sp. HW251 TaxID=3390998 RepID=UPI003D31909A
MSVTGGAEEAGSRGEVIGLVGLFVLAIATHALLALSQVHLYNVSLVDTDSYTRMLRVLQLWHGDGWYGTLLPQLNAPDGLPMHWSRPLDLLIIAPALPALLLGDDAELALQAAGALLCPVQHALACLVAVWAARGLWPRRWCWFAGLILLTTPSPFSYSIFGRADHHTLILLAGVATLGFALRAARGSAGAAWKAGIVLGLGVWVLPEVLLIGMPVLAAFGLLWLSGQRDAARQGMRIALGMALAIAVALPIERAPSALLQAQPDRISIHHLALGLVIAAVFAAVERLPPMRPPARAAAGGALAALGAGTLLLAWPQLIAGATASADGAYGAAFVAAVQEMQPLRFDSVAAWRDALLLAGGVIPATLALLLGLLLGREALGPHYRAPMLVVALAMLGCLAATISARRFALDLAAPVAIAASGLVPMVVQLASPYGPLARVPALVASTALAIFLPSFGGSGQAVAIRDCDPVAVARWLATGVPPVHGKAAWDGPVILADDLNVGPALAYFSGLRVVGAPYHQAGAALRDLHLAFGADEGVTREIVARRQVSLVLVCTAEMAERDPGGRDLRTRLIAGDVPAWLEPVAIPEEVSENLYRLFAVRPEAAAP